MSLVKVSRVAALPDYGLELWFSDGFHGTVNFFGLMRGPVFEPLKDPAYFARVFVSDGTICWPNGADFAPEVLRAKAAASATAA